MIQNNSRGARGGAGSGVLLHNFAFLTMFFLFSLRPLRLCVMKFKKIPRKIVLGTDFLLILIKLGTEFAILYVTI